MDFFRIRIGQLEFLFEYHDGNEQADDREDRHQQAQAGQGGGGLLGDGGFFIRIADQADQVQADAGKEYGYAAP